MNSRRRIALAPEAPDKSSYRLKLGDWKQQPMSALGQKQTFALHQPVLANKASRNIELVQLGADFNDLGCGSTSFEALRLGCENGTEMLDA